MPLTPEEEDRRDANILSRLERVGDIGCAEVTTNELLIWFGQKRFTPGIWRHINTLWERFLKRSPIHQDKQKKTPLLAGDRNGGWVLVWGDGVITTKEGWLQPVRELAKLEIPETASDED